MSQSKTNSQAVHGQKDPIATVVGLVSHGQPLTILGKQPWSTRANNMERRRDYVYRDPARHPDWKKLEAERRRLDAEAGIHSPVQTATEPPYVPDKRRVPKAKRTVTVLPAKRCPQCHFLLSSVVHQLKCAA